jgi:Cu(I)/Ag(I) efflux system membrane fusion protein
MDLVPVYEGEGGMNMAGVIMLKSNSVTAINVQTAPVQRRRIVRTLRVAGSITSNTRQASWFEFTAYERDLAWLKVGQTFKVTVPSAPGKIYKAQIELHGIRSYADVNFDVPSGSTTVRAEILNPPVEAGDLGAHRLFNGLYAEAGVEAETEEVLSIPRSAVLQPGSQQVVYADVGGGNYQQRKIQTGRVGDDFVEVLDGLNEKEMVVTSGSLLIDAETQISQSGN